MIYTKSLYVYSLLSSYYPKTVWFHDNNDFQSKLQENIEKCKETEAACAANEDGRRAGEARSFAAEQSLESMETELEEANAVATASNHKFEDVTRKLKVVEGEIAFIFLQLDISLHSFWPSLFYIQCKILLC